MERWSDMNTSMIIGIFLSGCGLTLSVVSIGGLIVVRYIEKKEG